MEEPKKDCVSYWEKIGILAKHGLYYRHIKEHQRSHWGLTKEQMDVYGVDSRLQPRVSLLTLLDKLDEYVIQVLGEVKKEQIELAASLVNRTDERNKYRPSRLIDMFVPPNQAADMQSNLAEIFPLWVERHGLAVAHRIRKVQIARLIIGEYWNKVIELIKAVKIAGS